MRAFLIAVFIALTSAWALAGSATTQFSQPEPNGGIPNVLKRIGWKLPPDATERTYDLGAESFVLQLPAEPAPDGKCGLLAFISPGESGEVPEQFLPVLEKHHLIWIAANKVGNKRPVWSRIALTLDAIHNVRQRYAIDDRRVYVSGVSGGGRVASFMGVCYADVCQGGLYIIGTDYYRQLPTGRRPNEFWPKAYEVPPAKILGLARKSVRHVMLNGADDQNRFQSQAIARQMKRDGFVSVTYIEVPGVGHRLPGEEWLEKAVSQLDEGAGQPRQTTRPARAKQ